MANFLNQLMVYVDGQRQKINAADNIEIGGTFTASSVSGNGSGLTSLSSAALTGALPAISGASLTSLNAGALATGTVADARLSANVALYDAAAPNFANTVTATAFAGNGASLTSLAAGNVTTGTLADARLSANIAKYDAAAPTFTNTVTAAAFSGSGAALTALSASALSTGTVDDARLPANLLRKDAASNTLTGNLSINGNLNVVGDIISGGAVNVVLADQFLDLNGNNLLGSAQPGGIAVNVLSTGTTFDVESFTAGGTGTDPTIVVTGDASALAAGDLIQVSQSASSNDGQYLVYTASYNGGTGKTTVTVRGNAVSAHPASAFPQLPFVHNQLTTATETAKLTAITVAVMAVSGGELYKTGHVAIAAGEWCYAYGANTTAFTDGWTSIAPAAAASLESAYTAGNTIQLTTGRNLTVSAPVSGTAAISLAANAASDISISAVLTLSATRLDLDNGNVAFEKAGEIAGITSGALTEGTIAYVNSSGASVAADAQAVSIGARQADGVITTDTDHLATVFGTKVRAAYNGSAPAIGDLVYLGGGANAGTCQAAVPTTGRVTVLGKCVVAGSAGLCTIIWAPDYIADL